MDLDLMGVIFVNEILCSLEKEGFIAHYFPGTKEKNKAVIVVGGASCNEKTSISMSGYLRRAGYNVLVLGFYLWKGLSKDLAKIPVEYAEKAVNWLKNTQGIEKIAMTGASTGAAYTLVCASLISDITCVIPVVPFDYVMEGTSPNNKRLHCSVYTYKGENLPYTETPMLDKGMLNWFKMAARAKGYGLKRFMRFGYDYMSDSLNQKSRIKVENMNADVLLLAVKDDDCWPSDVAVPRMLEVFEKNDYPHRIESYIYERGSHALVDGFSEMSGFTKLLVKTMIPTEKKYPKECEEARRDSCARIIKFIEKW